MGFSQKWLEEPPELPDYGEAPSTQIRQLATHIRKLCLEGTAPPLLVQWLYHYEQKFVAPNNRVVEPKKPEADAEPETPPAAPAPNEPPATAVPMPPKVADGVAEALKELAVGIKNLSAGFTGALEKIDTAYASSLDKLSEGIDKLHERQGKLDGAYGELSEGHRQLHEDHRSFLGLLFPHFEAMHKTTNESMQVFRNGIIAESKANSIVQGAQAASTLDQEAGKMVIGLLGEAAKKKIESMVGGETKPATAPAATPAAEKPAE